MRDLPPTATLRAFEVATRHGTFTSASEELHVTQSAVSHQLKNLEDIWGVQLFQRGKTLSLTPAGAAPAAIVWAFFMNLEATPAGLRGGNGRGRVKVRTNHSFPLKRLLPRLPQLAPPHPENLGTLHSTDTAINFASGEADVAIRLGGGNYPALHSEFMFREHIFPVASPDLLKRFGMPREPAELLRYPLLARDGSDLVPKWEVWFQNIGLGVTSLKESVRFPDTNMTVEAALLGQGIALVRSGHVEKEMRDGSLIRLFDVPFPSPVAYYFVCPKGIETRPHVVSFRNWLLKESTAAGLSYD